MYYMPKSEISAYLLQARVMATIGVTRGLGDHDLKVYNSNIYIKPFLSCCPEVRDTYINIWLPLCQSQM